MLIALTRDLSPALVRCELTHMTRQPIDLERARAQHSAYEARLKEAGCRVERLTAGPDMADSVFIEDTAIVFHELAVVARPGAVSRRVETAGVVDALRRYRELRWLEAPATMDGGDVLVVGRCVFVGRSSRTNDTGIEQMREMLRPLGYDVRSVDVRGCLHLKSAVTALTDDLLLVNPAWVATDSFAPFECVAVHPDEPLAANALRVGKHLIYPTSFPRTLERIGRRGLQVLTVDVTELAKAEGAVTCCSLVFQAGDN